MELLLRIKAILRRIGGNKENNIIRNGIFTIDSYGKKVFKEVKRLT